MAFVKITKSFSGRSQVLNRVPAIRMASNLQTETMSSRTIAFYLNQLLVDQTGWPIEEVDGRKFAHVAIHEGTGGDIGILLFEHDPSGYTLGLSKIAAQTYSLSVSYPRFKHYVLNEVPCPLTEIEFAIDEAQHHLLVQCPDWFRFNPLSVPKEEAPPIPIQTASVHDLKLNRQDRRAIGKRIANRLK